jgi:hypothetical protein
MLQVLLFLFIALAHADKIEQLPAKELAGYLVSFSKESHGLIKVKDLTDSTYMYEKLAWEAGKGGTIADCQATFTGVVPFTIHIDRRYWSAVGYLDRWGIIFHELGHCACGLGHVGEKSDEWISEFLSDLGFKTAHGYHYPDGCPISIMHYKVPHGDCIKVHREEYLKELFQKCERPVRLLLPLK